jgi:hypothetical protein
MEDVSCIGDIRSNIVRDIHRLDKIDLGVRSVIGKAGRGIHR